MRDFTPVGGSGPAHPPQPGPVRRLRCRPAFPPGVLRGFPSLCLHPAIPPHGWREAGERFDRTALPHARPWRRTANGSRPSLTRRVGVLQNVPGPRLYERPSIASGFVSFPAKTLLLFTQHFASGTVTLTVCAKPLCSLPDGRKILLYFAGRGKRAGSYFQISRVFLNLAALTTFL